MTIFDQVSLAGRAGAGLTAVKNLESGKGASLTVKPRIMYLQAGLALLALLAPVHGLMACW